MPKNVGLQDMMGVKALEGTPYFVLEDPSTQCGVNLAFESPVQVSVDVLRQNLVFILLTDSLYADRKFQH